MRLQGLLNSVWFQAILASIFFTVLFTYSMILNISTPIETAHGDTFHVILTFKHYFDVVLQNDWKNILNMPTFYGFKYSLLYSEFFIVEAILAFPFFLITKSVITAYNITSVLTIAFSFFSMFIFAHYITRRFLPSVLASVIYVFNPFVIGHFPDNLHYYSLQWIPLIFLYFEKYLKKQNGKDAFFVMLFLTLQLLTTITFGALLTVILPLYAIIRIYQQKILHKFSDIKKFISIGAILGLLMFCFFTVTINKTYELYFHNDSFGRNLEETSVFSPWVYDLLLTSPNNFLYGGLREWSRENLPTFTFDNPEYIERNLFMGVTVWILLFISYFVLRKTKYKKIWLVCMICAVFAILLSFGPRIRFTEDFSIPGPYGYVHSLNPLLQNLRVASRFMVLAFLFIGLIAAFTLDELISYFSKKIALVVGVIAIGLVTLEYSNVPWTFTPIPQEVKNYYSVLNKQKDINVIIEFPMGNLFSRIGYAKDQFVETRYMLWASVLHNKKLINGYSSYTPVNYPSRVEYTTVNFPTEVKLRQLKVWGVDGISMHRDEFYDAVEYDRIKSELEKLGVKKIEETNGIILFDLNK